MSALNHTCCICGTKYYACDRCPEVAQHTPWRTICDTEEHYRVFSVISMVNKGILNEEQAGKQLQEMGLSTEDLDKFIPEIQAVLKRFLPAAQQKHNAHVPHEQNGRDKQKTEE